MDHYYPAGCEEDAKRKDTYAVISIQDTHTGGFGVTFAENKFCKGVLTLYFDDVVKETKGAVLFDENMADSVIAFIRSHMDVDTLLIHCYAGQSRSRAIGAFAKKMMGKSNQTYFRQISFGQAHQMSMFIICWRMLGLEICWDESYR